MGRYKEWISVRGGGLKLLKYKNVFVCVCSSCMVADDLNCDIWLQIFEDVRGATLFILRFLIRVGQHPHKLPICPSTDSKVCDACSQAHS